jgi:hypothetical protein
MTLRVAVEPTAITLEPGRGPVTVDVNVGNLSSVVDEIAVWVDRDHPWLEASSAELRLMPHTDGAAQLELSVPNARHARAGTWPVDIRTRSNASGVVHRSRLDLTVPGLPGNLEVALERVKADASGATFEVVLRNGGMEPVVVSLQASDPEDEIRFRFRASSVEVPARSTSEGEARTILELSAPRPRGVEQRQRSFVVEARGADRQAQATGRLVQPGVRPLPWRPIVRVVLTALGSLFVALGSFQPWNTGAGAGSGRARTGFDWNYVELAGLVEQSPERLPGSVLPLLSAGAVMVLLAAAIALGLTGRTGRLTRAGAVLAVLLVVAFAILIGAVGGQGGVARGVWTIAVGSVAAFLGGSLARR